VDADGEDVDGGSGADAVREGVAAAAAVAPARSQGFGGETIVFAGNRVAQEGEERVTPVTSIRQGEIAGVTCHAFVLFNSSSPRD